MITSDVDQEYGPKGFSEHDPDIEPGQIAEPYWGALASHCLGNTCRRR